jgi:hypothetical protein
MLAGDLAETEGLYAGDGQHWPATAASNHFDRLRFPRENGHTACEALR